jgi:hypothetical protein
MFQGNSKIAQRRDKRREVQASEDSSELAALQT